MDTTAAVETVEMTNLEAQRRCLADYRRYAADADNQVSRAFWNALAATCEINIAGILRTGDDDFIPF